MGFSVNDALRCPAPGGGYRVWIIEGVHLGGTRQESLISLRTLDLENGDYLGKRMTVSVVPETILELAGLEVVNP